MAIITSESIKKEGQAFHLKRMITCPGHYLIHPSVDIYLREPVALLKNCSDYVEFKGERKKIKKMRIARDRWGRKKVDWKKLYELERQGNGLILHPQVSASWAIEHIYDPKGLLCMQCDKRCREGLGNVLERSIKRLNGISIKNKY